MKTWAILVVLNLLLESGMPLLAADPNPGGLKPPAQAAPANLVLNGITTLLGDKRALFKIPEVPGQAPEKNFMLAEGERFGEIRLLAVDPHQGVAQVEIHGVVQTISICKTPELVLTETPFDASAVGTNENLHFPGSAAGENPGVPDGMARSLVNGSLLAGGMGSSGGGSSSGAPPASSPGKIPASANGDSNGAAPAANVYQYWTKGAEQIEQARIETAQRVIDGTWPPYPLTPLTPPGTPAQLIGASSVFMEHGPGIVIAGK